MGNFFKSLPPSALYILGGFLVVLFIFSMRGRFRKKDEKKDKAEITFSDILDSPNVHRTMLWLALSFAMGLAGFIVSGIVRRLIG